MVSPEDNQGILRGAGTMQTEASEQLPALSADPTKVCGGIFICLGIYLLGTILGQSFLDQSDRRTCMGDHHRGCDQMYRHHGRQDHKLYCKRYELYVKGTAAGDHRRYRHQLYQY